MLLLQPWSFNTANLYLLTWRKRGGIRTSELEYSGHRSCENHNYFILSIFMQLSKLHLCGFSSHPWLVVALISPSFMSSWDVIILKLKCSSLPPQDWRRWIQILCVSSLKSISNDNGHCDMARCLCLLACMAALTVQVTKLGWYIVCMWYQLYNFILCRYCGSEIKRASYL